MFHTPPLIEVNLATLQGENKLVEQIDSVLSQTNHNFILRVRDDGSCDSTKDIIKSYAAGAPGRVVFVEDAYGRLGASGSFSRLLETSCADYIMFCDQDDVWLPDKITSTFLKMQSLEEAHGKQTPLLVHTDSRVVDEKLNVISESFWKHQNINPLGRESLNRLLVQNVVTGCTVMINRALYDFAKPIPADAVMHDWWLALVAAAFGKIGHVNQPTMLYRQHGSNEIGAKHWTPFFVLKKVLGDKEQIRAGIMNAQLQSRAFLERYKEKLSEQQRRAVECYAYMDDYTYLKKVYLLLRYRLFKAGLVRNLGLWAHI